MCRLKIVFGGRGGQRASTLPKGAPNIIATMLQYFFHLLSRCRQWYQHSEGQLSDTMGRKRHQEFADSSLGCTKLKTHMRLQRVVPQPILATGSVQVIPIPRSEQRTKTTKDLKPKVSRAQDQNRKLRTKSKSQG